jgi:hypothetical protein
VKLWDSRNDGILPLQDHDPDVPLVGKKHVLGARVMRSPDVSDGESGQFGVEIGRDGTQGSIGTVHPWMLWQTRDRGLRSVGAWAQGFAAITGRAMSSAGGAPITGDYAAVQPAGSFGWNSDSRFASIYPGWPRSFSRLPRGTLVAVFPTTSDTSQQEVMGSLDNRLFAPSTAGPATCGTLVVDLQPSGEACMAGSRTPGIGGRHARLQSAFRVVALEDGASRHVDLSGGNAIALNFGRGGVDNLAGLGMVWIRGWSGGPSGPITGGPGSGGEPPAGPVTGPITPGGSSGSQPLQLGDDMPGQDQESIANASLLRAASAADSSAALLGSGPDSSGKFSPERKGSHLIAILAEEGGGPIHGGALRGDKHHLGEDRDGHPIQIAHISTRACFFRDATYDAPLEFGRDYPHPPSWPLLAKVYLGYDKDSTHTHPGGTAAGLWRWWAEVPYFGPDVPVEDRPRPRPPTPGSPGAPGSPGSPPTPGGPGAPRTPAPPPPGPPGGQPRTPTGGAPPAPGAGSPPPGSRPITPNPMGPHGPRFPGYPITGGGSGPSAAPPAAPAAPGGPVGNGGAPETGGDLAPSSPGPSGGPGDDPQWWVGGANRARRAEPARPSVGGAPMVGQIGRADLALYAIHHPMLESFAGIAFRPQLDLLGEPDFLHGPGIDRSLIVRDEAVRPQVLAVRTWGAIDLATGDWRYARTPIASRARGGEADGGILYTPPGLELTDYFGLGDAASVLSPTTRSFVAVAPGVAMALGRPVQDGGLAAASVTIDQDHGATDQTLRVRQLDSGRVARDLLTARVIQSSGEIDVAIGGTQALRIPRGTTAQRPASPSGGAIRVNSSGSNDVVEHWDAIGGAWRTLLSGTIGTTGIADDAVTNAKLANMTAPAIKGRITSGTGDPEDLTVAQVRGMLGVHYTQWSESGDPVRTVGASSTAEGTLVAATIPALSSATGVWCLHIWGDFLQNSGGGNVSRIRIKISDGTTTTTIFDKSNSFASSSNRRGFVARIFVLPRGSTDKQRVIGELLLSQAVSGTSGFGDWGAFAATHGGLGSGDATLPADVDWTLSITNQWDSSSANSYFRIYGAKLVFMP